MHLFSKDMWNKGDYFMRIIMGTFLLLALGTVGHAQSPANPDSGKLVRLLCIGYQATLRERGLVVIVDQSSEAELQEKLDSDPSYIGPPEFQDASWFIPGNANHDRGDLTGDQLFKIHIYKDVQYSDFIDDFRVVSPKALKDVFHGLSADAKQRADQLLQQEPSRLIITAGVTADGRFMANWDRQLSTVRYDPHPFSGNIFEQDRSVFLSSGYDDSMSLYCIRYAVDP